MTAHELARQLLEKPDVPVEIMSTLTGYWWEVEWVDVSTDGTTVGIGNDH